MWIFCCGMMRSGSTLQFQITARLVEEAGLGKRIEWVDAKDFPQVRQKCASYNGWKVMKTHLCTEEMAMEFEKNNAKGVYIFRDIRDAFVSMMKKSNKNVDQMLASPFIDNCLQGYAKWTSLPGVLISRYEDVIRDIPGETTNIARHLGIGMSPDKIETIANDYTLERQLNRIEELKRTLPKQTSTSLPQFDSVELLHTNHIESGAVGKWRAVLSAAEVKALEERVGDWLIMTGYEQAML